MGERRSGKEVGEASKIIRKGKTGTRWGGTEEMGSDGGQMRLVGWVEGAMRDIGW